jgi:TatD DNase family protein
MTAPTSRLPPDVPVLAYPLHDALYLNLTSACTLACTFCPKIRDDDWVVGGFDLQLGRNPDAHAVWRAACDAGLAGRSEVVFTGLGEPTTRLPVLLDLAARLRAAGVARVRVDTDGLSMLRTGRDTPSELAQAGVVAVSVSLNAPDAATYARLCPSPYGERAWPAVVEFLRRAPACGLETTATVVALPGLDVAACAAVAQGLGVRFRARPADRLGRLPQAAAR